jgi:hypothetical protein
MEIILSELEEKARLNALSAQIERQASPVAEAVIRRLWIRMAEIFGHKWTSQYGEDAATGAGDTWARGLAGLSTRQIATGLDRLIAAEDWPPSLPEFRRLCFGIPSEVQVTLELHAKDSDRSPFTRLVWSRLDVYAFGRADQVRAERMLHDAYVLAKEHVMSGGELPPPLPQLNQSVVARPVVADPDRVKQCLEEISRTLEGTLDLPSQVEG